jgi:hypothetical protein
MEGASSGSPRARGEGVAQLPFLVAGPEAAGFGRSLGLGARLSRNVLAAAGAMELITTGERGEIVAIPLPGALGFSVSRRLTKGCQIHLS